MFKFLKGNSILQLIVAFLKVMIFLEILFFVVFDILLGGDIVVKKFFSEKFETFLVFFDIFENLVFVFVDVFFN